MGSRRVTGNWCAANRVALRGSALCALRAKGGWSLGPEGTWWAVRGLRPPIIFVELRSGAKMTMSHRARAGWVTKWPHSPPLGRPRNLVAQRVVLLRSTNQHPCHTRVARVGSCEPTRNFFDMLRMVCGSKNWATTRGLSSRSFVMTLGVSPQIRIAFPCVMFRFVARVRSRLYRKW